MHREIVTPKYKNAFNCKKCPESNDANGCPDWWELVETNDATNEQRILAGCARSQQIGAKYMEETMKAARQMTSQFSQFEDLAVNRIGEVAANNLPTLTRAAVAAMRDSKKALEEFTDGHPTTN